MAETIQVHYDVDPSLENEIASYMHCGKCIDELPEFVSPREYSRTQIGIRSDGRFQVWCNRHKCNVAVIDFKLKKRCTR